MKITRALTKEEVRYNAGKGLGALAGVEAQSSPLEPPRNTAEQPAGSQGLAGAPEGSGLAQLHISHAWHTTGI